MTDAAPPPATICDSLGAFADGEIEPAEAAAFRAHLGTCETCQRELVSTMEIIALMSEMAPLMRPGAGR